MYSVSYLPRTFPNPCGIAKQINKVTQSSRLPFRAEMNSDVHILQM